MKPAAIAEIVAALGGELHGDATRRIERIAPLATADATAIGFLANPRYRAQLATTRAACVVVAPDLVDAVAPGVATIATPDPYLYFARLTQWWVARSRAHDRTGIDPSAVVAPGARVHASATVGALAFVDDGAVVDEGAVVGAQCHVGRDAVIGAHTRLAPRVVVGERCRIGARGLVHGGAVIGADGFGFARDGGAWVKIEQLGAVVIGDEVEIGANTCIDRGALDDTVIEDGVKLDNLVQIGHNVRVGAHSAFAGCVGVAGSARIGRHCTAGGGAMIAGHVEIADRVHVSAGSFVRRSILQPGHYSGLFPFDDNANWEKNAATLRQLHTLRERLRALEKKLA